MREERIAARYGRALLLCTDDDVALEQIEKELSLLSSLVDATNSDLRALLLNPAFSEDEQAKVVREMASAFGFHELTQNLLLLLVEKGRAQLLTAISKVFSSEIDLKLGRVRARVSSAKILTDRELKDIVDALNLRVGKKIMAEVSIDEHALMGVKAQIGGLVFDGTLSTMLNRFKRQLVEASIN